MKKTVLFLSLAAMALPSVAQASSPKLEGSFTDWKVYSRAEGGDKVCYAISEPKSKSPSSVNHGDIYFMVSNWRSGAAKEQPSFMAGYSLKKNRAPEARVGSAKYKMFVAENEGFIESGSDERALVAKMRAGATMNVKAVSARGTNVNYAFSLKGITAALRKTKAICG
jgi:hypothetical protein